MKSNDNIDTCSFCGKHKDAVAKLIVGEHVAICNECVELCETLLADESIVKPTDPVELDPQVIKEHLDQYVSRKHVREQSNAERYRPGQVGYCLDEHDHRRQPHWSSGGQELAKK